MFLHRARRKQDQILSADHHHHHQKEHQKESSCQEAYSNDDHLSTFVPTEVQLKILAFVDIKSLRTMMTVSRTWHSLLTSHDAHRLWLNHSQRIWNLLQNSNSNNNNEEEDSLLKLQLIDDINNSTTDSTSSRNNRVNLPLLLSKAPKQQLPSTMNPLFERVSPLKASNNDGILKLKVTPGYNSHQAFSARSDHPLPRPSCQKMKRRHHNLQLLKFLRWVSRRCQNKNNPNWHAFVTPFSIFGEIPSSIHVTPRLVSYFEIAVEEPDETIMTPEYLRRFSFEDSFAEPFIKDCVVIGLATAAFDCRMELPGWDSDSFGYHSDTGALYHGGFYGTGTIQRSTHPFGTGDTVGMGIDYVRRGVFVTKNGELLGLVFDGLKNDYLATTDLYPVVGMDCKDTVVVNYGGAGKPFMFDLAAYCQQQQQQLPPKRRIPRS